jgi:3-hydroxybutyryl-CoA dehydratase
MKFVELKVGMKDTVAKTITEADVVLFAGITTDINPAHLNEEYAKTTPFKTRIVHGVFSAGLISACLANKLPGPGTIYLGQELKFTAPVHIGDTVTAELEIIEIREDKKIVTLSTVCKNQKGETVVTGKATVLHNVV